MGVCTWDIVPQSLGLGILPCSRFKRPISSEYPRNSAGRVAILPNQGRIGASRSGVTRILFWRIPSKVVKNLVGLSVSIT